MAGEIGHHEHLEITTLVLVVQKLAESQTELNSDLKELNTDMKDLVKSMGKQELILEKLANLEINSKESLNRIHKRVDKVEAEIEKININCSSKGCGALNSHKEICKTTSNTLKERIDTNDKHKTWLVLTILTSIIGAVMGTILIKGN